MGSRIIGVGSALPELVVTNNDLSQFVETDDEWITTRTGIHERHIAIEETTTSLGLSAARRALGQEMGGWCAQETPIDPESVDLIIAMSVSPDMVVPSQAALYKAQLGATNAVAYDLNAACAGCVYGMDTAASLLELSALQRLLAQIPSPQAANQVANQVSNQAAALHMAHRNVYKRALIIGADCMSRVTDWTDRATCVLFGDGAGAVVLEWQDNECGVLASRLVNIDDVKEALNLPNTFDTSTFPFADLSFVKPDDVLEKRSITMKGAAVFKFSTKVMASCVREVLERADMTIEDVDLIVPHQANERIIASAMKKLDLPLDKIHLTIGTVGNTSASSALIALADAYVQGKITEGMLVCMVGFGGGLTAGAVLFRA